MLSLARGVGKDAHAAGHIGDVGKAVLGKQVTSPWAAVAVRAVHNDFFIFQSADPR